MSVMETPEYKAALAGAVEASKVLEGVRALKAENEELKREITSYQIAKDNLELRLARAVLANAKPIVGTFAGHWTY